MIRTNRTYVQKNPSAKSSESVKYMSLRDVGHVTVASSTGWQIGCNTVRS